MLLWVYEINFSWIFIYKDNVNIASPERAFLDTLYLDSNYYYDNPSSLNKQKALSLLPIYNSDTPYCEVHGIPTIGQPIIASNLLL